MSRISLCMVVRDEAERLSRCLDAAKPYVDEMIIIDTGSTDATRDIAREAGARVIDHPWEDDFSAPRNRAFEEATGDWALVLDADEVLSPEAGKDLRRVASQDSILGVFFPFRNAYDDGKEIVTLMLRAVRIRPDIRYRYRIHEQMLSAAKSVAESESMMLVNSEGEVRHDGYLTDVMESKNKDARNRRLFEMQLRDTPDDLYILYRYADFLRRYSDAEEGEAILHHLERAYMLLQEESALVRRELTFGAEICALLALDLKSKERTDEAAQVCEYGLAHCHITPNLLYVHAHCAYDLGSYQTAEDSFRKCSDQHGQVLVMPAQPGVTGVGSRAGISRALAAQGEINQAAIMARETLSLYPESAEALVNWVDIETLTGDLAGLINQLIKRVNEKPQCATTWLKGGELMFRMQMFEKAIPWLARATELAEDSAPAYGVLGETLLAAGHIEPALDAFGRGYPDVRSRAGLLLLSLSHGLHPEVEPDSDDSLLKAEFSRMVGNLRRLGESRITSRLHDEARNYETTDPDSHAFLEQTLFQHA